MMLMRVVVVVERANGYRMELLNTETTHYSIVLGLFMVLICPRTTICRLLGFFP
jgi:hypothetical protein